MVVQILLQCKKIIKILQWVDVKAYHFDVGDNCSKCRYLFDAVSCQTFDHFQSNIPRYIKMPHFYVPVNETKRIILKEFHCKRKYRSFARNKS